MNIKLFLIQLDYNVKNFLLKIAKFIFYKKYNVANIHSILVVRTGSLGDNICSIPSLYLIRSFYHNKKIVLLSKDAISDFSLKNLTGFKLFDSNINYSGITLKNLFKLIKANNFDLVIDLSQCLSGFSIQLRNLVFFRLSGIRYALNWRVETTLLFKRHQEKELTFENEVNRMISRLVYSGLYWTEKPTDFSFLLKAACLGENRKLIDNIKSRYIVVAPESNKKIKEWGVNNFVGLVSKLTSLGYEIIIVGINPDDNFLSNNKVYDLRGRISVIEMLYIIKKSLLVISNDSAAAHISAIYSIPVVAIFSSWSYPVKWFPNGEEVVVIRKDVNCSICYNDKCTTRECMQISIHDVLQKVIFLLNKSKM